jgi:hypothetical protein
VARITVAGSEVVEVDAGGTGVGSGAGETGRKTRITSTIDLVVIRRTAIHADRVRTVVREDKVRTLASTADSV